MQKKLLPKTLTLRYCDAKGWPNGDVEMFIPSKPFPFRRDFLGLADVAAIVPGEQGVLFIQATSKSNHSSHVHKALAEPRLIPLLEAGNRFVIWSWDRTRGKENFREEEFTLDGIRKRKEG